MGKTLSLNFEIVSKKPLSTLVVNKNMNTFHDVLNYVANLPYQRISDFEKLNLVLEEGRGTCSSKHAFLAQLAIENNIEGLQLVIGIYTMNGNNTPAVASILKRHMLKDIPEAHTYLKYNDSYYDFTSNTIDVNNFLDDLVIEKEIFPNRITREKEIFHMLFIEKWREDNHVPLSISQIWSIREECIAALSKD